MNKLEMVNIIILGTTMIISIVSLVFSIINMNRVEKTNYGQLEFTIGMNIINAKKSLIDTTYSQEFQTIEEKKQKMKIAVENVIHCYDEACAKYIDKKIDKKRFKKAYRDEIKGLVEDEGSKNYFQFGSRYSAIKKVYKEWFY